MKILITGAQGMLGKRLVEVFSDSGEVLAYDRSRLDIRDFRSVDDAVQSTQPSHILNAAAYTKVDQAESEEEEAFATNSHGCRNLAIAAARSGATLVSYSTDYVFDGTSKTAYREWDPTAPANAYGRSKLAGELEIRRLCFQHLIIRTSWLYGADGEHFIRKIASLARERNQVKVVDDQRGSPTLTDDLAAATRLLVSNERRGLYHLSNSGACSWFELARAVLLHLNINCELVPVPSSEFPTPARRPANSVLDNRAYRLDGFERVRPWQEALQVYLSSDHV